MAVKALVTGSSLGHAEKCAAAAVLPRVGTDIPQAAFGSAGHEHVQLRAEHGVDVAMEQLPATAARWQLTEAQTGALTALLRKFEWTPPRGARAEVALCLMDDGRVVQIRGGRGEYELPAGGLFAMTIDLMWSDPSPLPRTDPPRPPASSTLWVIDLKFGRDSNVPPIAGNAQALAGAVLAARWTGAERVLPGILFVRPGKGDWDVLDHWLGPEQIDELHEQLVSTLGRVREQSRKLAAGEWLDYTEGPHCEYCPSQAHCPAKTALLQRYLGSPMQPSQLGELGALKPEQASALAGWLPQAERFLAQVRAALQAHVKANDGAPIDLGDGKLWGPHAVAKTVIDSRRALPVVTAQLGAGAAMEAFKVSKGGLEAVLRATPSDEPMAARMRQLMGQLAKAEALTKVQEIWWSAYRADTPEEEP